MTGALTRLKDLALTRLWRETPEHRARRRCRTLVAAPFAALGGLTWGVLAAPAIGTGSGLVWGVVGALALPLFVHVEQRVAPALAELGRRLGLGAGHLAAVVAEAAAVGGTVYWLTSVLGAPVVPAMGTALGVGAFYTVVMEYVICGGAATDVLSLVHGAGAVSGARGRTHAGADALLARGQVAEAIEAYREAIVSSPRDGSLYVRLARAQAQAGEPERALAALRAGIRRAKVTADQEAFLVRQLHELCAGPLGRPEEAEDDLRGLLERHPTSIHAAWARRELGLETDGG